MQLHNCSYAAKHMRLKKKVDCQLWLPLGSPYYTIFALFMLLGSCCTGAPKLPMLFFNKYRNFSRIKTYCVGC